jgi:hypothetical protein
MRTSFLASALLASFTASSLVACGGSDDGPSTFADADADTRAAAVVAGSGDLGILAGDVATLIGFTAYQTRAACPKATLSGTDLTVTGNCSIEDGPALDGSFVIHGFAAGCYPTTIDGVASEPLCLEALDDEDGGLDDSLRSLAGAAR